MKYNEYISLIQSLEVSAAANPGGYRFKVLLLTILGYAYFIGLILLLLAPLPVLGAFFLIAPGETWKLLFWGAKLWWVLIPGLGIYFGFLGAAARSITAKVPDPVGTVIERTDAPELFSFVETTCKEMRAPRPAQVMIDDSFNAGVVTMPRFGIFGRKVLLVLGLPLMKALSPEQFNAVLAHEIGHVSGRHGAFAKWAYQMREAWGRLIDSQNENDHKFSALYKRFVDWFFPYFTAYSFVLMREHEKDADRDAAKIVGHRSLGEALILMEAKGRKLNDEFWKGVHEENLVSEKPSEKMFTRMVGSLGFVSREAASASLADAIAVPTDFDDSHPSLAERLRLIGYWTNGELPELPENVEQDAATTFLSEELIARLTSSYDTEWDRQARATWKERHEHFRESDVRIKELEEKRASKEASHEEMRELAQRLTERDGLDAAVVCMEEAAERFPDDAVAWYNLGLARVSQNNDAGLQHLDKASDMDKSLRYDAAQLAFSYLRGKGRLDEARKYTQLLDEQAEVYEKGVEERKGASAADDWEPHDLSQEFIDSIPKKLAGLDEIAAIYAAHKKVKYLPESPYRVLFVEVRPKKKDDSEPKAIFEIVADRLDTGEIHFFALLDQSWGETGKKLDAIHGAKVYVGSPSKSS